MCSPSVAVQPEMRLYTITDLSTVWVQAQVFQRRSRANQDWRFGRAHLEHLSRPDLQRPRGFYLSASGRGHADGESARWSFPIPALELKPGMFVNVTPESSDGQQLVIPAGGVLQSGTRQIAFVDRGDGSIEPREVQLGSRVGDDFIVLKGLKAGEQIVTSANFLIDSESQLQAALGSFVPPPPGAGAASSMNAPQASAELTSDPRSSRKGAQRFPSEISGCRRMRPLPAPKSP